MSLPWVFTTFLHPNHLEDLVVLNHHDHIVFTVHSHDNSSIQIEYRGSFMELNLQGITSVSSSVFEENIGEDGISSQLTCKINIEESYYYFLFSELKTIIT
jgi:hypothetical protein